MLLCCHFEIVMSPICVFSRYFVETSTTCHVSLAQHVMSLFDRQLEKELGRRQVSIPGVSFEKTRYMFFMNFILVL